MIIIVVKINKKFFRKKNAFLVMKIRPRTRYIEAKGVLEICMLEKNKSFYSPLNYKDFSQHSRKNFSNRSMIKDLLKIIS